MKNQIKKILEQIEELNKKLGQEYREMAEKYGYKLKNSKVIFQEKIRKANRKYKLPSWKYVMPRSLRHLISIPFIYGMIIPAVILDVFLTIYQAVAFPLYRMPKARRRDFIRFDRQYLDYLNLIQKFNCMYCSYVNGLFGYAVEIAARTERYWCPVKASRRPKYHHDWYKEFADYGNAEQWKEKFNHFENGK